MSRVLAAIDRWSTERPSEPALRTTDRVWTWSELQIEIAKAVQWLAATLPAEGGVALALDNGPGFVVLDLALIRLGRACAPLPPFFTPAQRMAACGDAGAVAVLHPGKDLMLAGQAVQVSLTGAVPVPLHPGTAKITYTSGSTGTAKGVCLSLAQMETTAASLVERLGAYAGVHMAVLPLGVLLENVAGLYAVLLAGGVYCVPGLAQVGFARPFEPDFPRLAAMTADLGITSLILTPELLRGLLAAIAANERRLPDLKLVAVGGAKVSAGLLRRAHSLGVPAYQGYGLSECASVVALNSPGDHRDGSVGRLLPHISVHIAEDGEIVVGPRPFLGYVGGEPHQGDFRTGDIGALDADGFLSVSGRKSNILITAFGRNVAPEWVESELLAQPEIGQAMVFGEGQPSLGALLVPTRGAAPAAIALAVARANARLPEYAHVLRWRAVAPFDPAKGEVTANGRPRRAALSASHSGFINDFNSL